jgi:putative transposase
MVRLSSCAAVPIEPLPPTGQETGIDVGLQVFLIAADGELVETPRHYRLAEQRLAKAHRRVSRRTKGSTRRRKAVVLLRRAHETVQRQRTDCHHTTALALLRQDDTVSLEDLQVRTLVRNHHLAKRISDAGLAAFRTVLTRTAADVGTWVVAVPARFPCQDGSGCGARVPKSLSVRTHLCPSCGLVIDRDEHAARTILRAGQALRGLAALAAGVKRETPSR